MPIKVLGAAGAVACFHWHAFECECSTVKTFVRAEQGEDDFRFKKIDKKAYDRLGNLHQQGEDAFKRCFTQRAPQQPSFAQATKQAQALLAAAMEN